MAAIVSVVCARRPLSSSSRHPTAVGPLLRHHLHHLLHLLRRCRKTATRRTPPPPPPAIPAGGVNYWKIVGRSEILFLASRRQHGRDPSSVLYSAVPSGARLIYASSATVRWRSLRSSSRNVLLKPSPALAPCSGAREGDEFCLARSTLYLANFPSLSPFLLLPTVYRLFRIHAFAIQ